MQKSINPTVIQILEGEIDRHRAIVEKIESLIRELQAQDANHPVEGLLVGSTCAEAIEIILKDAGGLPMSKKAIFETLRGRGYMIPNLNCLSTVLSRERSRFKTLGKGVWALAGAAPAQPELVILKPVELGASQA